MEELKKRIRQGLQIKQSVLIDGFEGLAKMADTLFNAIERDKQIFLMGEGQAHLVAQILASRLFATTSSRQVKVRTLETHLTPFSGKLEQSITRQLDTYFDNEDILLVFCVRAEEPYLTRAIQKAKEKNGYVMAISGRKESFSRDLVNIGLTIPAQREEDILEIHLMIGNLFRSIIRTKIKSQQTMPSAQDMYIRFECHKCGDLIFTDRRFAGKKGSCPGCKAKVLVPEESTAEATGGRTEKRLHIRYKVQDCLIAYDKQSHPHSVAEKGEQFILEDLSEGGFSFLIEGYDKWSLIKNIKFKEKDVLYFLLDIPAYNSALKAKGEVRRIEVVKGRNACKVGIKFLEIGKEDRNRLKKLVESDILRNLRRATGLF